MTAAVNQAINDIDGIDGWDEIGADELARDAAAGMRRAAAEADARAFNEANPVGRTLVRYWRGVREGAPSGVGLTRSPAWALSGHTAVVMVEGTSGGIALTHVEVVDTEATR